MDLRVVIIAMAASFLGSIVAGITGYGQGLILLPILALLIGTKDAVPAVAIVQLFSNLFRASVHKSQLDWKIGLWFGLGAIPGAALGSAVFAHIAVRGLAVVVGGYLICIPFLRRRFEHVFKVSKTAFIGIGFVASFISALVGVVGPLAAPFFLSLGLARGAYVGTDAFASVFTHIAKTSGYAVNHVFTSESLLIGLLASPITFLGSWIGKLVTHRIKDHHFAGIIDAISIGFGLVMLIKGH